MAPKRIIAIENDYEEVGFFIETVLELEGYQPKAFADSFKGMAALRETPPDLLLLDLVMPGFSGWQILEMIQADPELAGIPIVVFTAAADSDVEDRAYRQGASAVLVKPVSAQQLVSAVRQEIGEA